MTTMETHLYTGSDEDYFNHPAFSQSDLKAILDSPREAYERKFGEMAKMESSGFRMGSMLDVFVLTPDEFDMLYVVLPMTIESPGSSAQLTTAVEMMVAGASMFDAFCQNYSTKGMDDKKIATEAEKKLTPYLPYVKFMQDNVGKTIITQNEMDNLVLMRSSLENNERINHLLFSEATDGVFTYNQMKILTMSDDLQEEGYVSFPMKGMVDRVIIDTNKKMIYIIDLKTTGRKKWSDFEQAAMEYGYPFQLAAYTFFVWNFVKNVLKQNASEYDLEVYLAVVQKHGLNDSRLYAISKKSFLDAAGEFEHAMKDTSWHIHTGQWNDSRYAVDNNNTYII